MEALDVLDVLEVMRRVLLCMPEAMHRVLRCMPEVMHCVLLCTLEVVEGGLWAQFRGLEISIAAPAQILYYRQRPVDPLNSVMAAPNLLWGPSNENGGS